MSVENETANQGGAAAEPAATPATESTVIAGTEIAHEGATETPPAAPAEGTTEPAKAGEEAPKRKPWWEQRIAATTAQKSELATQLRQAQAERDMYRALAEGKAPAEGETPPAEQPKPAAALPESEIDRRATLKAAEIARANDFNAACNRTFDAGKAEFTDFETVRDNLVAAMGDTIKERPEFLQALTTIPEGHKVFHALGKDLDEAARILSLPAIPMALELAKMAAVPKGKTLSKAPAPITPIDGNAKPSFDPETASQPEFEAWFNKKRAEKRA